MKLVNPVSARHNPNEGTVENCSPARMKPGAFSEADVWAEIAAGWRPLFAGMRQSGFSVEWHEFQCAASLDWSRSFHPGGIELCINLDGIGSISDAVQTVTLRPKFFTLYYQSEPPLKAWRQVEQWHRFITIEFSPAFVERHLRNQSDNLHPLVRAVVLHETAGSLVASPEPVTSVVLQLVESLKHCPVFKPAQELWFQCKALEIAAQLFFRPPDGELLCTRAQRAARERVEKVVVILNQELKSPPSLEQLGQRVGCSPYYLSRQFSAELGMTMQQYLRRVRLERAAELLRCGRCNVTEAAFEVGYNSLSHFSSAFHEAFGCCPGLYPVKTQTQRNGGA
ncbi:MAG: AraC family transcriptional regulator [Verrucomicrobiota bacterium]